ncbi:MAG: hypothetical protein OXC40_06855 [Proteobacteria bacterium]|nr:hypothetical protein [Pseudomonadota bacterium]
MFIRRHRRQLLTGQKPSKYPRRHSQQGASWWSITGVRHWMTGTRFRYYVLPSTIGLVLLGCVAYIVILRSESLLTPTLPELLGMNPSHSSDARTIPTLKKLIVARDGSQIIPATNHWQVSVESDQDLTSHDSSYQDITEASLKFLRTAHRDELNFLARYLTYESDYDRVIVSRRGPANIVVKVSAPKPIAVIQADKLRYVSESGQIFGVISQTAPKLTRFSGVFDDSIPVFKLTSHNKLIVSEEITTKLRLLIDLLLLVRDKGFQVITLDHHAFRGVKMVLAGPTQVTLGHPPFSKKISRLKSLLNQAEDSHKKIEKIELDYKGKAVIKTVSQKF